MRIIAPESAGRRSTSRRIHKKRERQRSVLANLTRINYSSRFGGAVSGDVGVVHTHARDMRPPLILGCVMARPLVSPCVCVRVRACVMVCSSDPGPINLSTVRYSSSYLVATVLPRASRRPHQLRRTPEMRAKPRSLALPCPKWG